MGNKVLIAIGSLAFSACLSSKVAPTQPIVTSPPLDGAEYRATLQTAWDHILRRSSNLSPPIADAEAGLSIPIPDHPAVRGAVEYFTTALKGSIQISLLRSSEYKDIIDAALDAEGLPRALAYLPVIESGYSTTLTSRAGAHGMWQFMTPTARLYGLRVDWWVDHRADPDRSTRAAARYLRVLYEEFGDWPLALAAYNCGPGRVRRALEKYQAGSFWELWAESALPKETRGYVPSFYAILLIVSDPETYGFRLANPMAQETAVVEMEGPLSLKFLASAAGVDEAVVRDLNPELRRGLVPPQRYGVRVPVHAVQLLASHAGTLRNQDPVMELARFTLRRGESLTSLSRLIGIDEEELLSMNGIASARPGQMIYVPLRQQELSARLQAERYHLVRKGDTLYSVAKKYGLTVSELRELNQLNRKHLIRSGDRLRVTPRAAVLAGN